MLLRLGEREEMEPPEASISPISIIPPPSKPIVIAGSKKGAKNKEKRIRNILMQTKEDPGFSVETTTSILSYQSEDEEALERRLSAGGGDDDGGDKVVPKVVELEEVILIFECEKGEEGEEGEEDDDLHHQEEFTEGDEGDDEVLLLFSSSLARLP
ncbi:hypothetical protein TYRP_015112 [Tyrophagus putrescentiae]|nr:hypothetical protein TYRP_015112 [Tyrophagus putrescentiae]